MSVVGEEGGQNCIWGAVSGAHDILVEAHARSEGLMLVTNNVREFQRIPGLRVDNRV